MTNNLAQFGITKRKSFSGFVDSVVFVFIDRRTWRIWFLCRLFIGTLRCPWPVSRIRCDWPQAGGRASNRWKDSLLPVFIESDHGSSNRLAPCQKWVLKCCRGERWGVKMILRDVQKAPPYRHHRQYYSALVVWFDALSMTQENRPKRVHGEMERSNLNLVRLCWMCVTSSYQLR